MPFNSDAERKAVFAKLLSQSSTGMPFSSSSPTLPKSEESKFLSRFVSSAFAKHKENKVLKGQAKEAKKEMEKQNAAAAIERAKQIEKLKADIRLLQSDKLSPEKRDELFGVILKKERGSLPKETVEKLEKQQMKNKEKLKMQKEEFLEGITEKNKDKIEEIDEKIAELMHDKTDPDKESKIRELKKKREEALERPVSPIMPGGVSEEDKQTLAAIDEKISEIEEKEAMENSDKLKELEKKKQDEIKDLQTEKEIYHDAKEEFEKEERKSPKPDYSVMEDNDNDTVDRATKYDSTVEEVAAAATVT